MKRLLLLLLLFISISAFSQSKIDFGVAQDMKLLFKGDNIGNDAPTMNLYFTFDFQGPQHSLGYWQVTPFYEIAKLSSGTYNRAGWGGGFSFNKFVKNIEVIPSYNYGAIMRNGQSWSSMEFKGTIRANITDRLNVNLVGTATQRKDIGEYVYSTFIGISYTIVDFRNFLNIHPWKRQQ